MQDLKNVLCVRTLNNIKLQVPINKGFEDFWLEDFLDVEWLNTDSEQLDEASGNVEDCFDKDGLLFGGQYYRFQMSREIPRIVEENKRKKQHPALKALANKDLPIVDLTLGEGRDSLTFLTSGREVLSFERQPLIAIYFLLNIKRLCEVMQLPENRLQLLIGNFFEESGNHHGKWEQFYYDPMYRPNKRKGLPRGAIQLFEEVVQDQDRDQKHNLELLIKKNKGRTVVKRAKQADPIVEKVNYQLETKLVRYDVYLNEKKD